MSCTAAASGTGVKLQSSSSLQCPATVRPTPRCCRTWLHEEVIQSLHSVLDLGHIQKLQDTGTKGLDLDTPGIEVEPAAHVQQE